MNLAQVRSILRRVFSRIFGISPSAGIKRFFKDLGIIAVSFSIARVLSAVASIAAARMLGREEFGDSQLVISVAQLFSIFAIFGLNSSVVRFGVGRKEPHGVMATAFWSVFVATLGAIILSFVFANPVIRAFVITRKMYILGTLCGIVYSFMMMVNSLQQTAGKFGLRGLTEITFSGAFLVGVGTFVFVEPSERTYVLGAWAYIAAYAATAIIGIIPILHFVRPRDFHLPQLRAMVPYSTYNFVCGAGFFLMYSLQRPLLNRLLSDSGAVGIFAVYSQATINLAAFLGSMVTTVFFPRVAAAANREHVWNLSVRAWLCATPLLFVAMFVAQSIVVWLAGKEYPLSLPLVASFAFAASVITVQTNLGTVVGAEGDRGARLGMFMSLAMGGTNLLLSRLLIPPLRIYGAPTALAISYGIGIVWLILVRHKYLKNPISSGEAAGSQ